MKEKVLTSMKPNDQYHDHQVLVSRKKIKNRDCVFLKLAEFELFIPSKYLSFATDAAQVQFIICSELLKSDSVTLEQAQIISALMTQEFKTKRKKLVGYEA
jgi:hypothetical protein